MTKIVKYMHEIEFIDEEVNKVVKDVIENKQFTHYISVVMCWGLVGFIVFPHMFKLIN